MPGLPQLLILATGGTIAGAATDAAAPLDYQAGVLDAATLLAAIPAARSLAAVKTQTLFSLDSKDLGPAHWLQLADRLRALMVDPDIDGIVVTHGTDTLEETACALELCLLRNKPVVLTAAMRPADAPSADGPMNLLQAIAAATHAPLAACGPLVAAGDQLWLARDIGKRHTHAVDALGAFAAAPLARFRASALNLPAVLPARGCAFPGALPAELPRVDILPGYAGASPSLLDVAVADGARGLVLALAGHGSVPGSWLPAITRAAAAGVAVVRASRVPAGGVLAQANFDDEAFGLIAAGPSTAWQARVRLAFGLANGLETGALRRLFSD